MSDTPAAAPTGGSHEAAADTAADAATQAFVAHRELLFAIAYDLLGSVADAEDVLQETWLARSSRRPVVTPYSRRSR